MKRHTYKCLLVSLIGLVLAFTFYPKNPAAAQEESQFQMLLIREAYVKEGKMMEAVQFVKELIEYQNKSLPDLKARVYLEVFGR